MAFIQLSNCFSQPKYLIRLLALVLCVCIATYQLYGCILKVIHPPTTTHNSFRLNKTLKYPSLTICRNPGYKINLFSKYGLLDLSDPSVTSFWKEFDFKNFTLKQFFDETTYTQEEVVPLQGFDGKLDALEIQEITKLTYGKCFKFTPKFLSTSWTKSGGYSLYMMTEAGESGMPSRLAHEPMQSPPLDPQQRVNYLFRESSKFGFHVFIHEPNERVADDGDQSESYMEYVYVESEQLMEYTLSVNEYKNLPSSDNNCRNEFEYSKSQCEEICLAEVVTKKVGCSTPWLKNEHLPPCATYEQTRNLIKTYNDYSKTDDEHCNCPRSCNITIYTPHVAQRNELDYGDQCAISMHFISNLVTVTEEIAIYDWSLFVSDLGGSLGFLLGVSVLGLISMVETIGKMCFSLKISSKKVNGAAKPDTTEKRKAAALPALEKGDPAVFPENTDNALVILKEKTYFSINDLYI